MFIKETFFAIFDAPFNFNGYRLPNAALTRGTPLAGLEAHAIE
jgi:hypothetical protein